MFKLFLCLNTRSMYFPDENQQGVEVSYDMVYGGVHLAWEWDPEIALRSVLHPIIYAAFYM